MAMSVLLRPTEDGFRVVGCCYVHGIMDGAALALGLEEQSFSVTYTDVLPQAE